MRKMRWTFVVGAVFVCVPSQQCSVCGVTIWGRERVQAAGVFYGCSSTDNLFSGTPLLALFYDIINPPHHHFLWPARGGYKGHTWAVIVCLADASANFLHHQSMTMLEVICFSLINQSIRWSLKVNWGSPRMHPCRGGGSKVTCLVHMWDCWDLDGE